MERGSCVALVPMEDVTEVRDYVSKIIVDALACSGIEVSEEFVISVIEDEFVPDGDSGVSINNISMVLNVKYAVENIITFIKGDAFDLTYALLISTASQVLRDESAKGLYIRLDYATNLQGLCGSIGYEFSKVKESLGGNQEDDYLKVCNKIMNLIEEKRWFTCANSTIAYLMCLGYLIVFAKQMPILEDPHGGTVQNAIKEGVLF